MKVLPKKVLMHLLESEHKENLLPDDYKCLLLKYRDYMEAVIDAAIEEICKRRDGNVS